MQMYGNKIQFQKDFVLVGLYKKANGQDLCATMVALPYRDNPVSHSNQNVA
jgi:hypothetical protein